LNDKIVFTPYDLGLGVTLGDKREVLVGGMCHVQFLAHQLILIWEVAQAPKPFLVVTFDDVETLRVLDETWMSTETNSKRWEGIDGSFARTVKGGEYPTALNLMNEIAGPVVHYEFVTGCDCVDVIARDKPVAMFVDRSQLTEYRLDFGDDNS